MTSKTTKSAKLAGLIKKTAQKLVNRPKHLQKLALTLPLLALFVEEVRAAQGKSAVFEDLQALTEFVEAQNLDDAQYAEIEESLDGVELAANDITAKDVAAVAEEETEKAAILEEEGGATAKRKAALLEPGSETGAGRGFAAEAESGAAGVAGEHAAAGATETFELAGLVVPVAPLPLLGTLAAGIGLATANTGGATNTETATGTTLSRTLKQLKTDGIAFVQPASGSNVINVELGTGAALTSTTGVTLFGDTDRDGTVTAAENAALQVNLIITNADQLAEVAALTGLTNFGVDSVRIDLSNQDLLNALTSDATLAQDLAAIRASGLTVTTIDMGAAASITESQAATLIDHGLSFAADDSITIASDANSTHLSTSLKDLHKLGVDAVSVSGVSNLSVDLGGLTSADLATGGAIATFDEALNITLNVANVAEYGVASGMADKLSAAHFDNVKLEITDTSGNGNVLDESLALLDTAALLHAPSNNINTILDIGGANVVGALSLTAAEANTLVAQGISFAASDDITIQEAAHTTHLGTTLKDLHKLGVDAVSVADAAVNDVLHINFGEGSAIDLAQAGLPHFDANLDVTVHAANASQLNELATLANTTGIDLGALGIDHVQLDLANQAAFDALFSNSPSLQATLSATTPVTRFEDAIAALHVDHVSIDTIDMASNAVSITDTQAQFLSAQGLDFAANDVVTVQASGTHLSNSLSELKKLGIDHVAMSASATSTDLHLSLGNDPNINLQGGLPKFDEDFHLTLDVANITQLRQVGQSIDSFKGIGVDEVQLNFASQNELKQFLFEDTLAGLQSTSLMDLTVETVRNQGAVTLNTIDIGGFNHEGVVHLTPDQMGSVIDAGLHFAAADHVTVDVASTFHSTDVGNLAQFGVDTIHITDAENFTTNQSLDTLVHKLQDLGVHELGISSSDFEASSAMTSNVKAFNWLASGSDFALQVDTGSTNTPENLGSLINMVQNGVDVLTGVGLADGAKWGDLIDTLHKSGLGNVELETTAKVHISDDLSAALYESGMLHALPEAAIAIDAGANKVLNTTLKAMADLGVDSVNADHKVYVELGLKPEDVHTLADLGDLFSAFGLDSAAPDTHLFGAKGAGLVVDQATFDNFNKMDPASVQTLLGDLNKLGFTEVDVVGTSAVEAVYEIKVTAQTPVLSQVAIIGSDTSGDLAHVFDPDILHKPVK